MWSPPSTGSNKAPVEKIIDVTGGSFSLAADLVLKSSDGTKFPVHKCLLAAASTIFADMFTLPQQPDSSTPSSTPIVEMSETSAVLHILLSHIYPVTKPHLTCLDGLVAILEAARKYDVSLVTWALSQELVSPRYLTSDPLGVYIFACIYGLKQESLIALKATMKLDVASLFRPSREGQMGQMLAVDLARLLKMRVDCVDTVKELLRKESLVLTGMEQCACGNLEPWVEEWIKTACQEMEIRPVADTIFSANFVLSCQNESSAGCDQCGTEFDSVSSSFSNLQAAVEAVWNGLGEA